MGLEGSKTGKGGKSKIVSTLICLVMAASIFASITLNLGLISMNASAAGGLADSPWPMFRQNLNHTSLSPYDTSANPGKLKWSFETNAYVFSSPAIDSDGTIYVGSHDDKLYAINQDGTEKWSFTTGDEVLSSPAINSYKTIYVGSGDNNLYAIHQNGFEIWRFPFPGSTQVYSSPAIGPDGTIYISVGGNLFAIKPDSTEKWRSKFIGSSYSSPAIGFNGTIYVGGGSKLWAINPNGTEKWNFITNGPVFSSPAIGSDGTIYVGSHDDKLYAINQDGTEKWNFMTGDDVYSSPAIGSDGTVYIGSNDNKLHAINPNGTEKWSFVTGDEVRYSSPAIGSDGTIYIGSYDAKLYAINPDGTEKWSYMTGALMQSSPTIGSDGTIYIGSFDSKLYAIGAPSLEVEVTSHFSELNSAAQSSITVHVTDGTNPVQGATVNLVSNNGGIFSPQSSITDVNGNFTSIFNAPTVTKLIICRITAQANKTGYNNGSGYVDITINPIPWPMFSHNCKRTGLSPYNTSGNLGKLKWCFTTSFIIQSSPVIDSDETIYIRNNANILYAIYPNGTEKWNLTINGQFDAIPTIGSDGTIFIGSDDNKFYAINPDGTEKWNITIENPVRTSAAIGSDGTLYFGTSNLADLYAINPNGTEKWRFRTGGGDVSHPGIGSDGTIYFGSSDNKLHAINPSGTEKWNFTTGDNVQSAPAIDSDETIYFCSQDSKLYAINPDGSEKWNFTTGDYVQSSPAIGSDGTIYVGSWGHILYALNPNGTEKWNFTTGNFISSSPAIGSDGTIYVGSYDKKLYAIDPNGTEKWNFTTGWWVHSSPAIGSDSTIYFGSWDYKLYAIWTSTQNQLPVANAGPDQTMNEGDMVQFNGSASYDPDGAIVSYEWDFNVSDGLWWETGAPPDAFGSNPTNTYNESDVFVATLRVTDDNGSMDTDTCEITVLVPPLPPILYINMSLDGKDVILYWDPPPVLGIDHYLIYRSISQIGFDFNTVWVNTSKDNETGEPSPIPLRTMWNDTKAALPDNNNSNYEQQYYYIIRAVNKLGRISITSRTVGKWTRTFSKGVSIFSLPLEPLETMNTTSDYFLKDMNASYIKWMDPVNHIWMKHGDGVLNDTQLEVGKGYEVKFGNQTNYTFTGMPGAMINYDDDTGFLGFDPNAEARNLTATVDPLTGNITLNWTKPSSKGVNNQYYVLRSSARDGFWTGNFVQLATLAFDMTSYTDIGNATEGTQFYYMIIPVNETGVKGASTYSIGVWTEEYTSDYDTFGIPLKLNYSQTADWYCDNIPNIVGINFFNVSAQRWSWHSTRMPSGAYDPVLVMTEGYQISTSNSAKFTFIGV